MLSWSMWLYNKSWAQLWPSSNFVPLPMLCGLPWLPCLCRNFRISVSTSTKWLVWILTRAEYQIKLKKTDILSVLSLLTHGRGIFLHLLLFRSSLFLLSEFHGFPHLFCTFFESYAQAFLLFWSSCKSYCVFKFRFQLLLHRKVITFCMLGVRHWPLAVVNC